MLVDGAHNPNGGRALCEALKALDLHDLTAVVGMLRDKDCLPVLRMMAPYCARMIITAVPNPRSCPAEEFAELARGVCRDITICPDCEEAARLALGYRRGTWCAGFRLAVPGFRRPAGDAGSAEEKLKHSPYFDRIFDAKLLFF